jgi:hypothetical protein
MMLKYQYTLKNSVMAEEPGRNHDAVHRSQIRPAQEHMEALAHGSDLPRAVRAILEQGLKLTNSRTNCL